MSEPVRYTLKHPVTLIFRGPEGEREEQLTELTLNRLKGKALRGLPANEAEQALHLIGKSAGLTPMEVDLIDLEDIADLGEVIEGFMPPGLRIGTTSSAT